MKKTFENLSANFLSREEMKNIKGGNETVGASINCTIRDQSTGELMSDGGCASTNMNDCMNYTARDASSFSTSTGHSMDYECH